MPKFCVELTYTTTVRGRNKDDATKNARKEMVLYPIKADVAYCEEV
jgi:hypothetical protein